MNTEISKLGKLALSAILCAAAGAFLCSSAFAADITAVWPTNYAVYSSPAVADLDNDGDLEVVTCSSNAAVPNATVYVWHHNGNPFSGNWPVTIANSQIAASPVIADVDGDGNLEIIIQSSKNMGSYYVGYFYVYKKNGTVASGWPQPVTWSGSGSPAVADFDPSYAGLEIAVVDCASPLQGNDRIYVWHYDGTAMSGWPKTYFSTANMSTPAFVDFDGNPANGLELVVSKGINDIVVWHRDGTTMSGFPADSNPRNIWISTWCSPAIADLDGNPANGLEVVTNGGRTLSGSIYDYKVFAWHSNDGSDVSGWPYDSVECCVAPVIVDINNDSMLEVVVSSATNIYILNRSGSVLTSWLCACASSPVIADIDGDGSVEIIVNGSDGKVYAWHTNGTAVTGWPKANGNALVKNGAPFSSSPAVADLDNDGTLEVIVGSSDSHVYVFTCSNNINTRKPWPTFRGNSERTSFYEPLYSINGYIMRHGSGAGMNGMKVTITGGAPPITLTTGSDRAGSPGYYEQKDLKSGTYTVQPANP